MTSQNIKPSEHKILNCRCICGIGLNWTDDTIVMLDPCEHILHKKCIKSKKCPMCSTAIAYYYTEEVVKYMANCNSKHYQKYVDMICMKNTNNMSVKNYSLFMKNMPLIADTLSKLPFARGFESGYKLCETALTIANIKLTVSGTKNIPKNNVIIISNHSSIMDFLILFYVFKCGFLASSSIKDTIIGKLISDIIPLLLIDRGANGDTVNKMKNYINTTGSLCLFPEGVIVHPDTLAQFRTGAFHAEKPILPVIIKYTPHVSDSSISDFFQKLASQKQIDVTVKILKTEYPPFNMDKIRKKMAMKGNLALSRVSNRDIADNAQKN